MNTIISSNSYNNPSFGMFKKPNEKVMNYFTKTLSKLDAKNRDIFVAQMGEIVKSAKDNPVGIEQSLGKGYEDCYTAIVNGRIFNNRSDNSANGILNTMKNAVNYANDVFNINQNAQKIRNIFGI